MSGPHGGTHTLLGGRQAAHRSGGSLTRYLGNLYRTLEAVRGRLQVDAELRRCFTPGWTARSELSSPRLAPGSMSRRKPAWHVSFQTAEISPFFCHVVSDSARSQVEEAGCFFWFFLGESSRENIIRARLPACVAPSRDSPAGRARFASVLPQPGHGTDGAVELLEARNPHGERPPRCSSFINHRFPSHRFPNHRPPRAPPSRSSSRWPQSRPAPPSKIPPRRPPPVLLHRQRRRPRLPPPGLRPRGPPSPVQPGLAARTNSAVPVRRSTLTSPSSSHPPTWTTSGSRSSPACSTPPRETSRVPRGTSNVRWC